MSRRRRASALAFALALLASCGVSSEDTPQRIEQTPQPASGPSVDSEAPPVSTSGTPTSTSTTKPTRSVRPTPTDRVTD
ncbi:MAG: hypothetical protein ACRDQB_15405 [Thermocrispum sp.]